MIFIDAVEAEKMEPQDARKAALKYSNLCKANIAVITQLEKINKDLAQALGKEHQCVLDAQAQLEGMKGRLFGKSTERRTGIEGPLFDPKPGEEPAKGKTVTYERKPRTKFGRTEQPELPRIQIKHELSDEEIKAQGLKPWEGQFEVSEQINVLPSRFVVEEHLRQKYLPVTPDQAPTEASPIVTAPGPLRLKEGSRYSIDFGVEVGLAKYEWHLPLDRQARKMKSYGLTVTSQVLFAQVDTVGWYLKTNVLPGIIARIRESRINQADETYLENLAKDAKKRFWLWSVLNPEAVLFEVFDSRTKQAAQAFLKDLEGVLLTDGYYAYRALASEKLILANDWAHVRRKFVSAEKTHATESQWFVEEIRKLFDIEKKIKADGSPPEGVFARRQSESKPIVESIEAKCRELVDKTLPQSPLGKAIRYTLKLWKGLTVFLDHPEVPMDTNAIERVQRAPVVGRKNYYGAKSLVNAQLAAVWHTVIQTCLINGVDPREYINETMRAILTKQDILMPWEWPTRTSAPARTAEEKRVSETAVFETPSGLTTKLPENDPIYGSKAVS